MEALATKIASINRIVEAIGEHVTAQEALAGGDEGVCADEAAQFRVVVAGLEVIEAGFLVVDIAGLWVPRVDARVPVVVRILPQAL